MTSEIRANTIKNRVGLGTIEYSNTGPVISGVTTALNFKTGTSNLHSTGLNIFDLDVDGHTNLDNVSIAGVTTTNGNISVSKSSGAATISVISHNNYATLEIGGQTGAFIDLKSPFADDYDIRYTHDGFIYAKTNINLSPNAGYVVNVNKNLNCAEDLDVDGHTNLDNVSIAGLTTFSGNAEFFGELKISNSSPVLKLIDSNSNSDFSIYGGAGVFNIYDETNSASRLTIASDGTITAIQGLVCSSTLTIPDSIIHSGDTNTKIRFPGNDAISFETAGNQRLRIYDDGIVAIGHSAKSNTVGAGNLDIQGNGTSCIIEMGNPFPNYSGGIVPEFRITATNSNHTVDFESVWGGDNLLHKHLSFSGGSTTFHKGTNDDEIARFTSSGNLLIGKTSSAGKAIEIYQGAYAALRIQNSSTGTGGSDGILIEAAGSDALFWNYESANMRFGTAGTERVRIDSSGRLLVGTTDSSLGSKLVVDTDISVIRSSSDPTLNFVLGSASSPTKLYRFLIDDDNSDKFQLRDLNTPRITITSGGEIGINVTDPESYGANGHGYLGLTVQAPSGGYSGITIRSNYAGGGQLAFADGSGSNAERKNLALAADHVNKRLNFLVEGATVCRLTEHGFHPNPADSASGTALDDYEEGTWTPTAYGFTISSTYSAKYTKIGRICHISCYVQAATGNGTSLQPHIGGLPFTSAGGNSYSYGAGRIGTGGYNNSQVDIAFQQQSNSTNVKFYVGGGGINESMMSGGHVIFSLVYQVA